MKSITVQRVRSRLTVYKEDAEIERSYKTRSGIPALQDTTTGPPPTAPPVEVADGSSLLGLGTRKRDYS